MGSLTLSPKNVTAATGHFIRHGLETPPPTNFPPGRHILCQHGMRFGDLLQGGEGGFEKLQAMLHAQGRLTLQIREGAGALQGVCLSGEFLSVLVQSGLQPTKHFSSQPALLRLILPLSAKPNHSAPHTFGRRSPRAEHLRNLPLDEQRKIHSAARRTECAPDDVQSPGSAA